VSAHKGCTFVLTSAQVHQIRTTGLTDRWWADKLRVRNATVRRARVGETYLEHPTPPDIAPRDQTGCTFAIRAGLPQKAVPKKQRRSWE
jgi:hypothetical protein